ncbi:MULTISPECIES: hypothetical protein [Microbacterium]|uniref:Lipoprotein n=1 Tax=Microbacterium mcarthurae TaxID=3035918 RepID=A0ABW9GF51_9MICO
MRHRFSICLIVIAVALLPGCSETKPSYDDVRAEAIAVMQQVNDLIPGPTTPRPRPEFDPFGCGSHPLSGEGSDSAFFTGYWEIEVSNEVDVPSFIADLPATLGDDWVVEDVGVDVPFAQVHLLQKSSRISLTVEHRDRNDKKGIDVLVMSRCGLQSKATPAL